MNRYLLIDRFNYTIYDCNTLDIENNFDEFGASVTCLDNYDLLNEFVKNVSTGEILGNNKITNDEKAFLLNRLQHEAQKELDKILETTGVFYEEQGGLSCYKTKNNNYYLINGVSPVDETLSADMVFIFKEDENEEHGILIGYVYGIGDTQAIIDKVKRYEMEMDKNDTRKN